MPRVRSGKEVRVGDHSRKELGSFRVDCERLCRGLTKQTPFFWLGHREIDTLNPSPILSAEKDSISPGDGSSGGDPGPERHPFAVWQIFGRRFKPHPQTILQWEFFLGLGDEKKRKNTCAHKFLFETTKTTSGSSIINTEKKRTSKTNISSYLSRSCTTVIDDRFPILAAPWFSSQRSAFNLEALDATSEDTGRGASRN